MRKTIIVAAFVAAAFATPAWAQGNSGSHGPPDGAGGGGGPPDFAGGGMGNGGGPPIDPPGLSSDPVAAARAIAEQRGQFGRDFADQRNGDNLTGRERAELQRQQAQSLQENVQIRRQQAQEFATAMRNGAQLPANAQSTLRSELKADLEQFKAEFRLGRDEWQAMRDQWIVDRDALTAEQWAQRRLDWFAFRDAWIDRQRQFAQARADD